MEKYKCKKISDSVPLSSIGLPIVSFDVSENGRILLGFKGNKVAVVDENKVLNFFEFSNDGSFYVQWKDNNILLLLVRGSIIVEFSQDGQLINMIEVDDNSIQNNSLWNQIAQKKHINIGQSSYCIKNNMGILNFFTSSYSQLLKTDSNGNSTVIYDVNSAQMTKTIILFVTVIIFMATVISGIVVQCFKLNRK